MKHTYVEAYKCKDCKNIMPKYRSGISPPMPYFLAHSCCPECGATMDKIKRITGYWVYKKVVVGPFWPLRSTEYRRDHFVERGSHEAKNRT